MKFHSFVCVHHQQSQSICPSICVRVCVCLVAAGEAVTEAVVVPCCILWGAVLWDGHVGSREALGVDCVVGTEPHQQCIVYRDNLLGYLDQKKRERVS